MTPTINNALAVKSLQQQLTGLEQQSLAMKAQASEMLDHARACDQLADSIRSVLSQVRPT